ncbi:MAG: deoxyribose-phosphate aldolase [Streptococcus salivarius]
MSVNSYIDHTLLKADANKEQILSLIDEAKKYEFASVCVNPTWVKTAAELLKDSSVKVCTVIGFPLGASTSAVKAFEAKDAIANGADEVDMVINIGALKSRNLKLVEDDIKAVVEASGRKLVKVIIETCLLTDEEKVEACQLAKLAGADFVKTSTGFSTGGATIEDIELMREGMLVLLWESRHLVEHAHYEAAQAFIKAGATRIGTSSGVAIMKGQESQCD